MEMYLDDLCGNLINRSRFIENLEGTTLKSITRLNKKNMVGNCFIWRFYVKEIADFKFTFGRCCFL